MWKGLDKLFSNIWTNKNNSWVKSSDVNSSIENASNATSSVIQSSDQWETQDKHYTAEDIARITEEQIVQIKEDWEKKQWRKEMEVLWTKVSTEWEKIPQEIKNEVDTTLKKRASLIHICSVMFIANLSGIADIKQWKEMYFKVIKHLPNLSEELGLEVKKYQKKFGFTIELFNNANDLISDGIDGIWEWIKNKLESLKSSHNISNDLLRCRLYKIDEEACYMQISPED